MSAVDWVTSYLVLIVGGVVLRGWALTVLWGWFISTTFKLPRLALVPAMGLMVVVRFLQDYRPSGIDTEKSQGERLAQTVGITVGVPLVALAMGWIVHLFM